MPTDAPPRTPHRSRLDPLCTLTEVGMLAYWIFAASAAIGLIDVPPEWMYSDYRDPVVVAWNWSFLPIDVAFACAGLVARFGRLDPGRRAHLRTVSLSLMFCAGAMAISFWTLRGAFDPFWWAVNLWLVMLPAASAIGALRRPA